MWKAISEYDRYDISDDGYIRNRDTNHILKPSINPRGYFIVTLCKNGKTKSFSVHKLVALSFIENPDNKPEVNHKDGIKTNNTSSNLEWVTRIENMRHAINTLKSDFNKLTKKPVIGINIITGKIVKFESGRSAGRWIDSINPRKSKCGNNIGNAIRRQISYHGYKWQYE